MDYEIFTEALLVPPPLMYIQYNSCLVTYTHKRFFEGRWGTKSFMCIFRGTIGLGGDKTGKRGRRQAMGKDSEKGGGKTATPAPKEVRREGRGGNKQY
jgi:hypothetical protein